jgi:N-acetylmuramoyl-L-alanine amidase
MRYIVRHLVLLLGLVMLLAGGVCPAAGKWEIYDVGGVKYVDLSDVWSFYSYSPKKGRDGFISYGGGKYVVSVKPEKQDFYVNNFRYILSFPVRRHGDKLLISTIDMKKLVHPVLKPRFSQHAGVMRTVVLDPGHGGHDAGAVSPWAREKDCNLQLAFKVKTRLEKHGFRVVMTRSSDVFLTLKQRVEIANRTPDSIFVSIHHNSGRRAAEGIETFTLSPQGTTSPFAKTRRYADLEGNAEFASINDFEYVAYTVGDSEEISAENLAGGWSVPDDAAGSAVPDDAKEAFDKAVGAFTGAEIVPLALLGNQIVAGTNYAFICKSTLTTEEPVTGIQVVTVYADLEDNAEIIGISTVDPADFNK